jgi:enamine deaminase RidA (YjgF/YER057c/UK114 family)
MSTGHAELHFTGLVEPRREAHGDDPGEQAQAALGRLADMFAERGLGLDDLLRLRLFVRNLGEMAPIEEALQTHLGPERPAVSIVEPPAASLPPGIAVSLDAVAAPGARERRRLGPGSARLGPWVFLGALGAVEPHALFAHMARRLREQGARLRDVVKVGGWLTFPMRDYGPLGQTRSALVGETGLLPASAAVQVGRVGRDGERLAFEAIAFAPEDRDGSPSGAADERSDGANPPAGTTSRLADFYVDARAAGGYVFTSGEVPDSRGQAHMQASEVYERLGAHLDAHGASPAHVVHQTVFVRRASDGDAIAEAAREFYGADTPPPTTLLNAADIGFNPGCDVEIELVASADGRPADAR